MSNTEIWTKSGKLRSLKNIKYDGDNSKDVAVCIVSRDRPDLTDQLVENINRHQGNLSIDIYVIEMGSENVSEHSSFWYEDKDFRGKAYGHNVSVRYAMLRGNYKYIFTIMNDVYFTKPKLGLQGLVNVMERNPDIGILSPTEPDSGYAGGICKPIKGREYHAVSQCNYLALLMKSEHLKSIGYLNPDFKYCWGATHELSYKMYLNGLKVAYCDIVQMFHMGSSTYGKVKNTVSRKQYLINAKRFAATYMRKTYGPNWDKLFTEALSDDVLFNTYTKHKLKWEKALGDKKMKNAKKLHLGCGRKKKAGWINIDGDKLVKPDVLADVKNLHMFKDNSVDVIECNHLIEHLTFAHAKAALKEWFRVLKPGGKLYVETPDLQRCVDMYNDPTPESRKYALNGFFGGSYMPDPSRPESIFQLHKSGWSTESLTAQLKKTGFKKVTKIPVVQTWRKATRFDRDMRLESIK